MAKKVLVSLDLNKNELQNAVIQNLASAPANGAAGQMYFNTTEHKLYVHNGTSWAEAGSVYTLPTASASTLGGVKIGGNVNISDGVISVADASNSGKGVIEIAEDSEITTGTSETLAVNPKQLKSVKDGLQEDIDDINDTIDTYGDIVTHNVAEFATAAQGEKADTALQVSNIKDVYTSTSTTDALSANKGKDLNDRLSNVEARGRFLSTWNCTTGKPGTDPSELPYDYNRGDYYIVSVVGESNNKKPSGNSYTGAASEEVETGDVAANDTYLYDGSSWILQHGAVQTVSFSSIAGQPTDNTNLATALAAKVDANSTITGATKCKITYDSKGLVTAGADLTAEDIPELPYLSDETTIDDLLPSQTGQSGKVLVTDGTNASWGDASKKLVVTNGALTPAGGIATWTITNTLGTNDVVVTVKQVSDGAEVMTDVTYGSGTITIKINSTENIVADTYKAVIIG